MVVLGPHCQLKTALQIQTVEECNAALQCEGCKEDLREKKKRSKHVQGIARDAQRLRRDVANKIRLLPLERTCALPVPVLCRQEESHGPRGPHGRFPEADRLMWCTAARRCR